MNFSKVLNNRLANQPLGNNQCLHNVMATLYVFNYTNTIVNFLITDKKKTCVENTLLLNVPK